MTDYYRPTDEDIALVRRFVGNTEPPTDDDLYDAIQDAGSATLAAEQLLQGRLGDLLSKPASFSISGVYSESNSANIDALKGKIEELQVINGTATSSVRVVDLYRSDRRFR